MNSIKLIIVILLGCLINSCKNEKTEKYYYGYVYNSKKEPLENVKITLLPDGDKTYTNRKGYFYLLKTPGIESSLIFSKIGYSSDTIPSIVGSEILYRNFKGDTTYLIIKPSID